MNISPNLETAIFLISTAQSKQKKNGGESFKIQADIVAIIFSFLRGGLSSKGTPNTGC